MARQVVNGRHVRGAVVPALLLVLAITAGCGAQSEMTDLWRDPSFAAGPVHNLFVLAIRKDPVRRRIWEDAFVGELSARGVTATPSYRLYPEAIPDTLELIETVRRNGYDAMLVSSRLPDVEESTQVPGTVTSETVTGLDFYGTIRAYTTEVQSAGYTETDEIRRFQTNVWTTGSGGRLVGSGTLRTLESVDDRAIAAAVSRQIVPALEKQGLVPARR